MNRQWTEQQQRNQTLLDAARYLDERVVSKPLPFFIDIAQQESLTADQLHLLEALQIEAARIALRSLASLAQINELDHLGGGLDLIPAFTLTRAVANNQQVHYTFEHAHTSIGHYAVLAAWDYLQADDVIDGFRRGLDIAGHVSWLPGGTPLNGGRLGVMVPVAVGQALGLRAQHGEDAWVVCHLGDAGWISGQALNGFNAADLHNAPISFVMHRNGIQLSDTNAAVMDKDPRPMIAAMGVELIEIASLRDGAALYTAYRQANELARAGRPALIYPTGTQDHSLVAFADSLGIADEAAAFAARHGVDPNTPVWAPGSLMSYRDVESMLECLFFVNGLPGGQGHHDGHMKGRDLEAVLANPMLQFSDAQAAALANARAAERVEVITAARPAPGSENLVLPDEAVRGVTLPDAGKWTSARAGTQAAYELVARTHPESMFVVSCDLDPSTKLHAARKHLPAQQQFEMSIEEQAAALIANGLAMDGAPRRLTVFSTFAAFFEGIAREGLELWRYQRNLTGVNEGVNVTFHMSHVGACTGRDHFSGWSLDWITLALGYLPYLHRFYAPADARSAFVAVRDLAAHYGAHLIGVPRDNLPVLTKQDSNEPLWQGDEAWQAVTPYRRYAGARRAILALGAPAYLAGEVAEAEGDVDVLIINGLPLSEDTLPGLLAQYPDGIVTIEDGLIATPETGLRGFAGLVRTAAYGSGVPLEHIGIVDPRTAPSDGHAETWAHFGITAENLRAAVRGLSAS
jgi:transketolase N-terminal domain/subunit/transketolase C-terminal domain/subunit